MVLDIFPWLHVALFQGVTGVRPAYIAMGLIWSMTLGFADGNFACSLVHRLPRGRLLLDKKPYCGSCGKLLETRDLFPVVSALLLRHKCRYCGAPFPKSHTWTELLTGLLFCACFLQFGFSQDYLLVAGIGTFLIIMSAIEANDGVAMMPVLITLAVIGALYRTLHDHELYNFFYGGFMALMLGALAWRKHIKPVNHVYSLPAHLRMVIAAGIIVGAHQLVLAAVLWFSFWLAFYLVSLMTKKPVVFSVPLSLAVMALLLIPIIPQ